MIIYTINRDPVEAGYILVLEITAADPLPKELFVFRRDIDGNDLYSSVTTVKGLDDYPLLPEVGNPFFRKEKMEREFATVEVLETFVASVDVDFRQLNVDYSKILDNGLYGQTETVVISDV